MNDESTIRTHTEEVSPTGTPILGGNSEPAGFPGASRGNGDAVLERAAQKPLLASDECERLRGQWETLQIGFVDDPRHAVDEARQLVSETVREVTQRLADGERRLRQEPQSAAEVSTEEQRVTFQQYRSYFEKLLAI
jgi:hypothetical protein